MTAAAAIPARLEIGEVARRTFGAVGRNLGAFSLLALLFSAIPQFVLQGAQRAVRAGDTDAWGLVALGVLVLLIGAFLLQGALTYATVQDQNGKRASLGDILTKGVGSILPLIGLGIVMGVAVFFGFLLVIVPGVLMALAWSVSTPTLVVERKGIFGSMARSAELTRNYRGAILLLAFVYWVLSVIVSLVAGVILGVVFVAAGGVDALQNPAVAATEAGIVSLVGAASSLVGAAGVAALYCELRAIKEGVGPESLAAVFD